MRFLYAWTTVLWLALCADSCSWPTVDVLFILDSTANVGPENHELMKKFVLKVVDSMGIEGADSRVAVAQFTPMARHEISLAAGLSRVEVLKEEIMGIPYEPCISKGDDDRCHPSASINSLAKSGLSSAEGNRQWAPDLVIVISSALYSIPELNENEVLLHPTSPIHAFFITVGGASSLYGDLQSSATNVRLSAIDFDALDDLIAPLCQSANDFIGTLRETTSATLIGGSTCLIIIISMAVAFIFICLLFGYSVYSYRRDYKETKERLRKRENDIKRQYDYYRNQLELERRRADDRATHRGDYQTTTHRENQQTTTHEATEANRGQRQTREEDNKRNTQEGTTHSGNLTNPSGGGQRTTHDAFNETTTTRTSKPKTSKVKHPNSLESQSEGEEYSTEEEVSESDSIQRTVSHLPDGHPARSLPPVDLLFLVDSSSSIGLTNFESVKGFLMSFIDNVDIAPGRSRIATIIFDKEPTVYFSFDRFYSHNTVKKALSKLPYRGGPTFLAKALNFAAGALWQEQNMRKGRRRKHKLMPTPKHDRLQVMVVVSDGYSEDEVEKAMTQMHDRLRVKIAAVVTKSFNKERMVPVTRFDGAVFLQDQKEALSLWLWRQQKLWYENYGSYMKREKSLPLSTSRT